jgi:serine/threonine-protein kinase
VITLFLLHPIKQVPVQVWTFKDEPVIRIGRSTDNHVILYSAVVSRHHVELRRTNNNWEIINLGTNGTYLDGKRIDQVPAVDGAIIRLARSGPNIQIRLGAEAATNLPNSITGDRPFMGKESLPPADTEIRDQLREVRRELSDIQREKKSGTTPSSIADALPTGTIPVPPHLKLVAEAPTVIQERLRKKKEGSFASTMAATRILKTLGSVMPKVRAPKGDRPSQGNPIGESDTVEALQNVEGYQLIQALGQGEIGVTYLATCAGQQFALKTLNAQWASNPKAHAALECESEMLQQLSHPRMPQWIEFFFSGGQPYLITEFIPGSTFTQYILQHGALSLDMAIAWILELCDMLVYLHGFVPPMLHRGIRPNSLIYSESQRVVLVDFGTVKTIALGQRLPAGRTGYSAPEQLELNATPCVDLYALAPTLAYLITGQNPLTYFAERAEGYRFCGGLVPGISPELADILDRLTHPKAEERYQEAQQVIDALQSLSLHSAS